MIDPVRYMMMTDHQNQNQNIITVEEGMDAREDNSRFFSLLNHETKLDITISKTSAITSCKLDGHEIVINESLYHQTHETWAIGDRPYQKIGSLPWNCHVRGAELLLSTSNGISTILYELTRYNELNSLVKLRSIHVQTQVFYFNLNNAKEKTTLEGHSIVVQCNGNLNRIQVQNTKLLCNCNKRSPLLSASLVSDLPSLLSEYVTTDQDVNEDDVIISDAIYSLNSTCSLDILKVQLNYRHRSLTFEIRSNPNVTHASSVNQNTNVASSTNVLKSALSKTHDLQAPLASGSATHSLGNEVSVDSGTSRDYSISCPIDSSSTNSTRSLNNVTSNTSLNNSTEATSNTVLRVRVRITNYGVCIMPIMMSNYSYTYSFAW